MSYRALLEYARAAAYMCTPHANLGQPPRKQFVLQLEAAREQRHARLANVVERLQTSTASAEQAQLAGELGAILFPESHAENPVSGFG